MMQATSSPPVPVAPSACASRIKCRRGAGYPRHHAPGGHPSAELGASNTPHATGVHRPLEASAAAFQDTAGRWHYLITADLGWWQSLRTYSDIYRPLCTGLGAEPAAVLLHLVHTHAGPSLSEDAAEGEELLIIETYKKELIGRLLSACEAARADAAPSTITWAYGRCDLAVNRE